MLATSAASYRRQRLQHLRPCPGGRLGAGPSRFSAANPKGPFSASRAGLRRRQFAGVPDNQTAGCLAIKDNFLPCLGTFVYGQNQLNAASALVAVDHGFAVLSDGF